MSNKETAFHGVGIWKYTIIIIDSLIYGEICVFFISISFSLCMMEDSFL